MSSISLNTRKTVIIASLIGLLLVTAILFTRHNRFNGSESWIELQPLSNLNSGNSCATLSPVRPDEAGGAVPPSKAQPPSSTLRNFTVVTAYINIGTFIKGRPGNTRNSDTYLNWMWPYRLIQNGVVAYFDDVSMAAAFTELRRGLPTKIIMLDRSKLWAFSLVERIRAVFSQPGYPQNHPKSTNAEYVAAMHAKYELVARAVREYDTFGSSYVAWMDLGIYRDLSRASTESFMLRANPCLHDEAIMYARIYPMVNGHTIEKVMRDGIDWVSGNFFIARRDVLAQFCDEYAQNVESYLNRGLANHDQSVLLAMYLPGSEPRPSAPLQAFIPSGSDDAWFNMALQSRRDAMGAPRSGQHTESCSYDIYA